MKRKVKEKLLEMSLPRMLRGEQEICETKLHKHTSIRFLDGKYPRFWRPIVSGRVFSTGWRTNLPDPTPAFRVALTPSPATEFPLTLQPN
jgi:hypothetical protein